MSKWCVPPNVWYNNLLPYCETDEERALLKELYDKAVQRHRGKLASLAELVNYRNESPSLDEHYCTNCKECTEHICYYSTHERDSSSDRFICQKCKWEYFGMTGEYHPPN